MKKVYLSTGEDYPDALAGSVLAAASASPVILVSSSIDQLTSKYINDNEANILNCDIFGGDSVVNQSVVQKIFNFTQ